MLRIIREVDPPTPSHRVSTLGARATDIANRRGAEPQGLSKFLRGDLDWIVMRALEKDRRRRYGSAADFAVDIERHFRNQPVVARPPGLTYRTSKFVRRHRVPVLAATILVTVTSAALATVVNSRLAMRRREAAQLLLARGLQLQRSGESMQVADDMSFERAFVQADSAFAEAEREDPSFATPVVKRALLKYRESRRGDIRDTARLRRLADAGLAHVAHALALNPTNAEAYEIRGNIQYWTWILGMPGDSAARAALLRQAQADLERATALNPKQAGAWSSLSHLYYQLEEAGTKDVINAARRAIEADSFVVNANVLLRRLFLASYDAMAFESATRYCASLHGRFPKDAGGWSCKLYLLTAEPNVPDVSFAWQLADSVVTRTPKAGSDFEQRRMNMLVAAVLARASADKPSLADSARRVVERAARGAPVVPTNDLAWFRAFVYTLLGDDDVALRQLRAYLAVNPSRAKSLAADPGWWFQRLAKDPRFAQLTRESQK
jgi:hypothetical protein